MNQIFMKVPKGATKDRKRVGRGQGCGRGCTAGKGNKGQNARSGGGVRPGFEGGQMPLYRRIARRGFSHKMFKQVYTILNIGDLGKFAANETVDKESLVKKGLVKKNVGLIKLLSKGEIEKKLSISIDSVSEKAREKIEKAGGTIALTKPESKKKKKRIKALNKKNALSIKDTVKSKNEKNEDQE